MKVRNAPAGALSPALQAQLERVRSERGFEASAVAQGKVLLINSYCDQHDIDAVVVGLSGGIDSAVVAALLQAARATEGSPITRIVPIFLPVHDQRAATGQQDARLRAELTASCLGLDLLEVDLSEPHRAMLEAAGAGVGAAVDDWASGQLVSYLRTPALYFQTSLLTATGHKALVAGTTNRDEGAYLGYVGKASDGMVDLQLITDLHKSEVYKLARALDLPEPLLEATPTGDMYDGRIDEEVFGAPYDFVELYLSWLCLSKGRRHELRAELDADDQRSFESMALALERVHRHNAHKYLVGSPAVHLNVLPSAVPGGWR